MIYVIPRSGGNLREFNPVKITDAVMKANNACGSQLTPGTAQKISKEIEEYAKSLSRPVSVSEIEAMVVSLLSQESKLVADTYESFRLQHQHTRGVNTTDKEFESLRMNKNAFLKGENANKDTRLISTKDSYYAGIIKKDYARRKLYSKESIAAHDAGLIHIHDMTDPDRFNCVIVNLSRMLREGTVISGVKIEPPKSLRTAVNLTMEIINQVSSNQYGGITFYLSDLAPYVEVSRNKIRESVKEEAKLTGISYSDSQIGRIVEKRLADEIKDAVQTIQYELITEQTTGGQTPFVSMSINTHRTQGKQERADLKLLANEVFRQRKEGVKNSFGVKTYPTFPKLLFFLNEENVSPTEKDYDLFCKAVSCTAETMNPDYLSAKKMIEIKGTEVDPMGCRSEQSVMIVDKETEKTDLFKKLMDSLEEGCFIRKRDRVLCDPTGEPLIKGRPNMGVVTLNLTYISLLSGGDLNQFWKELDMGANLVHQAQLERLEQLKGMSADAAPILFQHGAYVKLPEGASIDPIIYNGFSSISFGYSGLAEAVMYLTKENYLSESSQNLAVQIMERMNDYCLEWKKEENLGWSIYGTPMESTIGKFSEKVKERFGEIPGITDKGYISNSYHIPVEQEIDAFSKLAMESKFQELSSGGSISYVEIPNMQDNEEALRALVSFMYENNMYSEVNCKIDTCNTCGYHGEMDIVEGENQDTLLFACPNCGEKDPDHLDIIRRMCGYLGKYERGWNKGRFNEIANRILHL